MATTQEQKNLQAEIQKLKHEGSARLIKQWLIGKQERINEQWPNTTGESLLTLQGEARGIQQLLKMMDAE